jgi:hypothetical protein
MHFDQIKDTKIQFVLDCHQYGSYVMQKKKLNKLKNYRALFVCRFDFPFVRTTLQHQSPATVPLMAAKSEIGTHASLAIIVSIVAAAGWGGGGIARSHSNSASAIRMSVHY